jgi:hypothetical protein
VDLQTYLSSVPTTEESARRAVLPYAHLTAQQRFDALRDLLREIELLRGSRPLLRDPRDEDFWRHWKDPSLGRPY